MDDSQAILNDALRAARNELKAAYNKVNNYNRLIVQLEKMIDDGSVEPRKVRVRGCLSAVTEWIAGTDLELFHVGIIYDQLQGRFTTDSITKTMWTLTKTGQIEKVGQTVKYVCKGATRPCHYSLYRVCSVC